MQRRLAALAAARRLRRRRAGAEPAGEPAAGACVLCVCLGARRGGWRFRGGCHSRRRLRQENVLRWVNTAGAGAHAGRQRPRHSAKPTSTQHSPCGFEDIDAAGWHRNSVSRHVLQAGRSRHLRRGGDGGAQQVLWPEQLRDDAARHAVAETHLHPST